MPQIPDGGPQPATPAAYFRAIAQAYGARGRDVTPLFDRAQVTPAQLADDGARFSAAQLELCAGGAMRDLDDEAPGWFSRRLPWGSYGLLARASITAPDAGTALKRWGRHHFLLTDDIRLDLAVEEGRAHLTLTECREIGLAGPDVREFCLMSVLRNAVGLTCWLVDSRIPLIEAAFPFAPPPHADAYPRLLACPVGFGAPAARFSFDARYLALKVRRDEAALRQMLADALPLIVHRYRHDRLLVQRLRSLLAARPGDFNRAEEVAAALNTSIRTLHRHLAQEGTSLQHLKDEARLAAALRLLGRSRKPVKQVAAALGFAGEKSFARAFRAWTGESPAEYRNRLAVQ